MKIEPGSTEWCQKYADEAVEFVRSLPPFSGSRPRKVSKEYLELVQAGLEIEMDALRESGIRAGDDD